ncbi:fp25k [Clostera anachoreta granulovirus]|uniref:Fp25k n=1 Tax=Clostera anachoreta granulovirus TaxID=283675 RepID=F4ZKX9_9BBAC|nr:fp25k [Clostera anachoreta granulovirus]AEB00390.1 fp25k [Clostera anachoreta granulovirus]
MCEMRERRQFDKCVEIFGLGNWNNFDHCLNALCVALGLNIKDMQAYERRGNGLLVKLIDERAVNEWERKSREIRLRLGDLLQDGGNVKVKVFAAAPARLKVLLHAVRSQLPTFKYIWIGKRGVMVRHGSRTPIHVIKNEDDLEYVSSRFGVSDE